VNEEQLDELFDVAYKAQGHLRAGPGKVIVVHELESDALKVGNILIPTEASSNMENSGMKHLRTGICCIVDAMPDNNAPELRAVKGGEFWYHVIESSYTGFTNSDFDWIPRGYMLRIYGGYEPASKALLWKTPS
jgi:hypothetical protein